MIAGIQTPPSKAVTFDNCWAFQNGIDLWDEGSAFNGDGNGFKLGAGVGAHLLINCLAYDNPHHGIDINGNTEGVTVYNCTCVDNGSTNFYFDEHNSANVLRNNVSYLASVNIYDEVDDEYNSWNGFTLVDDDFAGLDPTGIDGPRESDGSLPRLSFMRPFTGSTLIDAGLYVGLDYEQAAPDLGAFEWIAGDCVADGVIDTADLECLAMNWLDSSCGVCNGADFDGNSDVNLADFEELAANWLK